MIKISLIEPKEDIINSLKEQYSEHQLLKISMLKNHFIVRTIMAYEFNDIADKYDPSNDKDLEKMKIDILKEAVVYPAGFSALLDSDGNYPIGLVDNLYEKAMYVSGLTAPMDIEPLNDIHPKPDSDVIDSLKNKYKNNVLVGISTVVGYFIIKGLTSNEFYDIKEVIRGRSETNPEISPDEINKITDEMILKKALIWPEGYYDDHISDQVPTGVMSIVSGYVIEATGWGEPDIEIIE